LAQDLHNRRNAAKSSPPEKAYIGIRYRRRHFSSARGFTMSNRSSLSLVELEEHIAVARDNIRQLIEQAAAMSGAEDEDRNADRIAQQSEELDRLMKQRDALLQMKSPT
jgi:hypothetical protein